jgi:hypothetical protein
VGIFFLGISFSVEVGFFLVCVGGIFFGLLGGGGLGLRVRSGVG